MAIISCPECGKKVSDRAAACPDCGCPINVTPVAAAMVDASKDVTNILNLARSSFESQNYSQAEEFCNQVIAIDGTCYEAWKLKGESINYQIGANNQRILEAYNCIMTAYDVLEEAEKEVKKYEILDTLKDLMESEVTFWTEQFENDRPTDATLKRTQNAYVNAYNKMANAFDVLGLERSKAGYLWNFDNFFIQKANHACVSLWKTTVAYNYFRDDLGNLGARWNRNNATTESGTDYFRPGKEIFSTFLSETGILIEMLEYCVKQFNSETDEGDMKNVYSNLAYFNEIPINQCSYKPMVTTWTNGYGAVTGRHEYYEIDTALTAEAKKLRQKDVQKYKLLEKGTEEVVRLRKENAQREKYWEEHAEERVELESRKTELNAQIQSLNEELSKLEEQLKNVQEKGKNPVAASSELENLRKQISSLMCQKNALGLFKGKEKKALQAQIDELEAQVPAISQKEKQQEKERDESISAEKAPILAKITELSGKKRTLQKEIDDIDNELTKNR